MTRSSSFATATKTISSPALSLPYFLPARV